MRSAGAGRDEHRRLERENSEHELILPKETHGDERDALRRAIQAAKTKLSSVKGSVWHSVTGPVTAMVAIIEFVY